MSLVSELRRRNVFRMAVLYAVAAWLIMQVAEVLMSVVGLPTWAGRATFTVLAIGFPIALIFSWFYEITPEGISLEKDVHPAESITHITGRRLDFIAISLLCAAVIMFSYDKWWLRDEMTVAPAASNSIAVLPFVNMSTDPEQEYFSDGISEELLNVLSKLPGLRVVARTSSFQFKGENRDIIDIGKRLNATLLLEGSVRKAGPQVRITSQLIDASNGFHLWSETYDRELEDIFAVQDEISAAIVGALKEHLGLQVAAAPRVIVATNTEAHDAYLRGRYLLVQRTQTTLEGAVRELEKAISLDPDYAPAHAELAIAILLLRRNQYGDLTNTEALARATHYAERAMAIDPTLAEAHAVTGFVLWHEELQEEALTHFKQAIQINPNYSIVYSWLGNLYHELGRYKEEFAMVETALLLDPLSRPAIANRFYRLMERNRLAEAERELEKLATIAPAFHASVRGTLTSLGGKWANAVLASLDALRIDPEGLRSRQHLTWQFAAIGLEKEALAISEHPLPVGLSWLGEPRDAVTTAEARLAEDPNSTLARQNLGLALAGAGDYARARPILEEIWQQYGQRVTCCYLFQADSAAALIAIRLDAGEEAKVSELVAAIRDNVHRYHEAGITRPALGHYYSVGYEYEEGLADYLASERETGLALIAKGAEDGYFIPQQEAYLQMLYDDPGFAPIRAMQETRQARERERFLAIVCSDNPYAAVWQPANSLLRPLSTDLLQYGQHARGTNREKSGCRYLSQDCSVL